MAESVWCEVRNLRVLKGTISYSSFHIPQELLGLRGVTTRVFTSRPNQSLQWNLTELGLKPKLFSITTITRHHASRFRSLSFSFFFPVRLGLSSRWFSRKQFPELADNFHGVVGSPSYTIFFSHVHYCVHAASTTPRE